MWELLEMLCLLIILMNSTTQLMLMIYAIKELRAKKEVDKKEIERVKREQEKNIDVYIRDVCDELLKKVESVIETTLTKEISKKEIEEIKEIKELYKYIEGNRKKSEKIIVENIIKETSSKEMKRENEERNRATHALEDSRDSRMVGIQFNREIALYLNEINQSINKAEYGKYIDDGWLDIGTGDGRSILAEAEKIIYGKGNVKIKKMRSKPEWYMAIPGKTQWRGDDLCSDAMKECYLVKDVSENVRYKIVRIQSPGILQRSGAEFSVVQKGNIEVTRIG